MIARKPTWFCGSSRRKLSVVSPLRHSLFAKDKGRHRWGPSHLQFNPTLIVFVAGALPRHELANGRASAGRGGSGSLVGLDIVARGFCAAHGTNAESHFLFGGVHLNDLELELLIRLQLDGSAVSVRRFRVVAQAFDPIGNLDECAEARQAQHLAVNDIAHAVLLEEGVPHIGLQLLHTQRQAALVRLDGQYDGLHLVALLQDFGRMLHALGPAQVADVDQSVDSVFDFDEGAEVGQVADFAFHHRAHREFLMQTLPGIRLQLLQAQADAALLRIYVQHYGLNLVANIDQLGGMLHALGPSHLADVYQPFDALLQLDERAVVGHADHAAAYMRTDGITLRCVQPRVRRELFEAQRHALLVAVELQHLHLDLVAHLHQVARVGQATPGHIGDVQQSVNASQVNEGAVVGQILDRAGENSVFVQLLQGLGSLLGLLFFQQLLAGGDYVAALLVQLDDADLDLMALQAVEVTHRPQIDLRTREEGASAQNVNRQASLDPIDDARLDRSLVVVRFLNLVPRMQTLRLLVREMDVAFFGVAGLAHDCNLIPAFDRDVAFVVGKFRDLDHALGFVANVHDHVLRRNLKDRAGNDLFLVQRGFSLGLFLLEGFESGGEIFHGRFFFRPRSGCTSGLGRMRAGLRCLFEVRLLGSRAGLGGLLEVRLLGSSAGLGGLLEVRRLGSSAGLRGLLGLRLLGSAGVLGRGGGSVVGFFERHVVAYIHSRALRTRREPYKNGLLV